MATAGHVDHGKTALIRGLTGVDTDTLQEERARGLTISPGFAYHQFAAADNAGEVVTLGFVDVPGHADFIPNMLAGVGSVNHALLVVAADDGVMPQTREHLTILQLLGITGVVVALSKIDRASATRVRQVQHHVARLLAAGGFDRADFFPVDNLSGHGVAELLACLQHKAQHSTTSRTAMAAHRTRFLIDRSFTVKGIGTVVTGTLQRGRLPSREPLVLSASGEPVRIRGMRLHQREIATLLPGQRAALHINLSHEQVQRGDWLQEQASYHPASRVDVALRLSDHAPALQASAQYHLYTGASHHLVNVRCLQAGSEFHQLRSRQALHVHHGDRFVLRDPAARTTIGGGRVLDSFVPRKGRSSAMRLQELHIKQQDHAPAFTALLSRSPLGVDCEQFARNYDLSAAAMEILLQQAGDTAVILHLPAPGGTRMVDNQALQAIAGQIQQGIESFHAANPTVQGISEPQLHEIMDFPGSPLLLSAVLDRLLAQGQIARTGALLHSPQHQAVMNPEQQQFLHSIRPLLQAAGRVPPRTRELVEQTRIPLPSLERILRQCTRSGMLIKVADNRHFLPETIAELAEFAEQLAAAAGAEQGFSVIQFRDASGIGRNLCIEILEYFDRTGFTRRQDNARFIRTPREDIFD